jgi:hydrogenase maturation protein HypF
MTAKRTASLSTSSVFAVKPAAGEAIRVRGLVQGVGFRPAVWRIACECGLVGEVLNDGDGVLIRAFAPSGAIDAFAARLLAEAPPLARIDSLERTSFALDVGEKLPAGFNIAKSAATPANTGIVPDTATCPACLAEVMDPANRRYRYPFTNCTHCGPRLSIIYALPYDRPQTSMAAFPMCPDCQAEYDNPADRRFHAQPNACPACGPHVWLEDANGSPVLLGAATDAIARTAELIADGAIVAVKSIGGFHLACDAGNAEAVRQLRARKHRDHKPLALMARDTPMVRRYVSVDSAEAALLKHRAAPIVLLQRAPEGEPLAPEIAPGQNTLGFMLPYTPLHYLLMQTLSRPIVLTSGNLSEEPQCTANDDARARLTGIADYWLLHDRDIVNRLDDSVVRVAWEGTRIIRRARGFAPEPLRLPAGFEGAPPVLAMGGALKSAFCLLRGGEAVLSQHIGDLDKPATLADYRAMLELYHQLYAFAPEAVAVDLHHDYPSTTAGERLADEAGGLPVIRVQHHHAHITACMAECGVPLGAPSVLGVALDGLGLGDDGTIWGGEFLAATYTGYRRLAHFASVPMLGGDAATREPWRGAYAHIARTIGWEAAAAEFPRLPFIEFMRGKQLGVLAAMMRQNLNAPEASSAGRLFDAVAASIGIYRERVSYEGQAAIELEALAASAMDNADATPYPFSTGTVSAPEGSPPILGFAPLWCAILADLAKAVAPALIAARFHKGLAAAVAQLAIRLASQEQLETVALTGGVFQNQLMLEGVACVLGNAGLRVLAPQSIPANDGGLALGQAVIAAARISK